MLEAGTFTLFHKPRDQKSYLYAALEYFSIFIHFKFHKWDFPGGPVVKTLRSQCRGYGFDPWSGKVLHDVWHGQKIKK